MSFWSVLLVWEVPAGGSGAQALPCPALLTLKGKKRDGMTLGFNPKGIGLGGFAAVDGGRGWERKRRETGFCRLVAIVRCTRHNFLARHYRLSTIPRQTLNPKPQTLNPIAELWLPLHDGVVRCWCACESRNPKPQTLQCGLVLAKWEGKNTAGH